jgi:hypothetical protein
MRGFESGMGARSNDAVKREFSMGGASRLIRAAEKLAANGRTDLAVEQLVVAQKLDPGNRYIQAIIDRIQPMQGLGGKLGGESSANQGPLSVTVGRQFVNGIRSEEDQILSPEAVHLKVRSLTNMADNFLEHGSSEMAFDALLKAYLLDPLSPYVIAAEKSVIPAWENARIKAQQTIAPSSGFSTGITDTISHLGTSAMAPTNSNGLSSSFPLRPAQNAPQQGDDQSRLELLKQQKEQERLEKERSVWREASKAPRVFGEDDPVNFSGEQPPVESPKPHQGGLFSRLKLGKFLE